MEIFPCSSKRVKEAATRPCSRATTTVAARMMSLLWRSLSALQSVCPQLQLAFAVHLLIQWWQEGCFCSGDISLLFKVYVRSCPLPLQSSNSCNGGTRDVFALEIFSSSSQGHRVSALQQKCLEMCGTRKSVTNKHRYSQKGKHSMCWQIRANCICTQQLCSTRKSVTHRHGYFNRYSGVTFLPAEN